MAAILVLVFFVTWQPVRQVATTNLVIPLLSAYAQPETTIGQGRGVYEAALITEGEAVLYVGLPLGLRDVLLPLTLLLLAFPTKPYAAAYGLVMGGLAIVLLGLASLAASGSGLGLNLYQFIAGYPLSTLRLGAPLLAVLHLINEMRGRRPRRTGPTTGQ